LSDKEWEEIFDSMPDLISVHDENLRLLKVNKTFDETFHVSSNGLIGRPCYEVVHGTKEPLPNCPMIKAMKTKQPVVEQYFEPNLSKHVEVFAAPISGNSDSCRVMHIIRDISKNKKMEEQVISLSKLKAAEQIAEGVGHDFNNLLAVILGNVSLAKENIKTGGQVVPLLTEAEKAIILSKDLIKRFVTYITGNITIKTVISTQELVKDVTDLALSGSKISTKYSLPDDLWQTEIDKLQVGQAIHNILASVTDHISTGSMIEISAQNENVSRGSMNIPSSMHEGDYVQLCISIQHSGLTTEDIRKIINPLTSAEPSFQNGNGLNIAATAAFIIQKNCGHIYAESLLKKGIKIYIYLPAFKKIIVDQKIKKERKDIKKQKSEGPQRILFMDDEKPLRMLAKELLPRMGYQVEVVSDGEEAFQKYSKAMYKGEPFDAIILDLTIKGGMGAMETLKMLKEIDSDVKALLISGYENDKIMSSWKDYGFQGAVSKPFTQKQLTDALIEII